MASCSCELCGNRFTARVLEDDPDTNSTVIEPDVCPECGSEAVTVEEINSDED